MHGRQPSIVVGEDLAGPRPTPNCSGFVNRPSSILHEELQGAGIDRRGLKAEPLVEVGGAIADRVHENCPSGDVLCSAKRAPKSIAQQPGPESFTLHRSINREAG